MSLRPKWQKIAHRNWSEVKGAWLANVPEFPSVGFRPDPGVGRLDGLKGLSVSSAPQRFPDVEGLRRNVLWEAVFLFHKCSHTSLAAQRLAEAGMRSWALFNAYHSAYIGAKGIMALLGVVFPTLASKEVVLDVFPPVSSKSRRGVQTGQFEEFLVIPIGRRLEQRFVWEVFQRVLRQSESRCWDQSSRDELLDLSWEDISRPRNHFLYRVLHWPLDDLIVDSTGDWNDFWSTDLDIDNEDFLLKLSFIVYRLFEQLVIDFSKQSPIIAEQLKGSRCFNDNSRPVALECYASYIASHDSNT